jgi:tRNA G10  N-methylase Trm11
LILVLAFGDLSNLEACSLLAEDLAGATRISEDILEVKLRSGKCNYENLAGIHKVVLPITRSLPALEDAAPDVGRYLEGAKDRFDFSVSYYSSQGITDSEYEATVATLLNIVREAGHRKANLVRSRQGSDVHAKDVLSRRLTDFVVVRASGGYRVGVTSYIPNTGEFRARSNKRPVVSSQISISSRLAKVLVNLGGLSRGQTMLDPFCGSGTILSEAMVAGVNCIGVDRNPIRIKNTESNLKWLISSGKSGLGSYHLKVADATNPKPLLDSNTLVDAVVTEPILLPMIEYAPRSEKARRMIRNASRLYSESLYSIAPVVRSGGRVVIVTPSLRTSQGREVSVDLQNLEEIGLREFRAPMFETGYPVTIAHENTKWIRRLVFVYERS